MTIAEEILAQRLRGNFAATHLDYSADYHEGAWNDKDMHPLCVVVRERYTYADGSVIVGCGHPRDWALGYNDCYCKRDDGCTCGKNAGESK